MKNVFLAAALAASLSGCHVLMAPAVVALSTAVGTASGAASIAKDVLEIDVSARSLFGVQPFKASPAAVQ
jgi:hypothetical protein